MSLERVTDQGAYALAQSMCGNAGTNRFHAAHLCQDSILLGRAKGSHTLPVADIEFSGDWRHAGCNGKAEAQTFDMQPVSRSLPTTARNPVRLIQPPA